MKENHKARISLFMTGLAGGGAERQMLTVASGIAKRGYSVDLVVTSARGPLLGEVPDNVRLVDLGASRIIKAVVPLARYLRREQPKAMLSAMCSANCVAIWARALTRVPMHLVVSERNNLSTATAGAATWRSRAMPWIMRWSYPHADGVLAISGGVADDLAKTIGLVREKIAVIYNPAFTPRVLELSREPVDHPWFASDEPPVILGVGRLTPQKDFPTLIRAFAKLRQTRDARLMILGEGEERDTLERLIQELGVQDDVVLPGFVSNPYAYMRAASVFVLSSRWEGFGNVLVEAMACGTPVVSTDCPSGPAEILEDGRFGRLVTVNDSKSLASAIAASLEDNTCSQITAMPELLDRFRATTIVSRYLTLMLGYGNAKRRS